MAHCVPQPYKARASQFPPTADSNHSSKNNKNSIPLHSRTTQFTHTCLKKCLFSRRNLRTIRIPTSAAAPVPPPGDYKHSNSGRLFVSDMAVERNRNTSHIATIGAIIGMHLLCVFAPFTFTWGALRIAVGLYLITGLLGITLSFHRNLSHRSFKLPKWLEYTFAYCGVQALQGNPINWVSTHRYHHQFSDSEKDPHSPLKGFWFSHMGWLFDATQRCEKSNNVGDLEKQSYYRFIRRTYVVHPVVLGVVLYAMGGLPYVVWGMGVRVVWVYHITWLVNSACHVWGKHVWKTGDLSRNNWWVAVVAFGEGWHNNHHAFEYSARHGLKWWEIDMTWYVVRVLEAVGLATDVKLPTIAHMQRMT